MDGIETVDAHRNLRNFIDSMPINSLAGSPDTLEI